VHVCVVVYVVAHVYDVAIYIVAREGEPNCKVCVVARARKLRYKVCVVARAKEPSYKVCIAAKRESGKF
jgi:hypothetical protein